MSERNESRFPEWAEQERAGDLAWIGENLHIFWPAAQLGYETVGRGAIVVDTTLRPTGGGHPFGYLDQVAIEQGMPEDTQRLVREYDPSWEFVTALLKSQDRISSYRLGVIPPEPRENLDSRVEANPPEKPSEAGLEPPDIETLMEWDAEGGCEAACPHHCWVEPDGICSHGNPSWLLKLGMI
jgi:hypothetical protein